MVDLCILICGVAIILISAIALLEMLGFPKMLAEIVKQLKRIADSLEGDLMRDIDYKAYIQVKACQNRLTPQQYKTLRGQVLAGDGNGALKGLRKILREG